MFKSKITKLSVALVTAFLMMVVSWSLMGCSVDGEKSGEAENTNATNTQENVEQTDVTANENVVMTADAADPFSKGIHHAVLTVEGYGPINITLNADAAPVSVSNFAKLAKKGYYNGLTFYRFQEGFCLQGGTAGNSASSADTNLDKIIGEFKENNVPNALADNFKRGTVAMARTMEPNSATSTFFVTLGTSDAVSLSLNGKYAAFGEIDDKSMVIVDKIVADRAAAKKDQMGMVMQDSDQAKITSIAIID